MKKEKSNLGYYALFGIGLLVLSGGGSEQEQKTETSVDDPHPEEENPTQTTPLPTENGEQEQKEIETKKIIRPKKEKSETFKSKPKANRPPTDKAQALKNYNQLYGWLDEPGVLIGLTSQELKEVASELVELRKELNKEIQKNPPGPKRRD